jgi:hypothetical protein
MGNTTLADSVQVRCPKCAYEISVRDKTPGNFAVFKEKHPYGICHVLTENEDAGGEIQWSAGPLACLHLNAVWETVKRSGSR